MSIRQFQPRGDRRRALSAGRSRILYGLLAIAIAFQISYPLVHGETLRLVTLSTVFVGSLAMVIHAEFAYGVRYAFTFLIVTFAFGLGVEAFGSKTGWPFGKYSYDASLGLHVAGVPLVVPFAWVLMAHPILIVARKLTVHWVFLLGGFGLMAWDIFLDPQMVSAGRWSWKFTGSHVPFEPEIPLSNTVGWLLAGMGLMALLHLILPKDRRKRGANFLAIDIFLGWTWFSGIVGNIFFFHRPGIAFIGGLTLALVLAPYFFRTWFGRPEDH